MISTMARGKVNKLPMPLRLVLKSLAKYPVKNYSVNNISQSSDSFTQLCITFNVIDDDVPVSNAKNNFTRRHKFWLDRSFDHVQTRNNRKCNAAKSVHGKPKETSANNGLVVSNVSVEGRQPQSKDAGREEAMMSTSDRPEDVTLGVLIKTEPGISSDMDTLVVRDAARKMVNCTTAESKRQDVGVRRTALRLRPSQEKVLHGFSGLPTQGVDHVHTHTVPEQFQGPTKISEDPNTRPLVPAPVTRNPLAPAPMTSNPLAPAQMTSNPLAPAKMTSNPLAPAKMTSNTLAPAQITSNPLALAPMTSNPLAPAEMTSNPLAPAPVRSNPLAPPPVTSNPLDPATVTSNPLAPAPVTSKDVLYMKLADMADKVYDFNPEPYRTAHGVFTITDFPGVESQFTLNRYDQTAGTYRNINLEGAGSMRKLICDLGVRCQSAFVRQLVARIVLTSKHDDMSNGELEWFVLLLT